MPDRPLLVALEGPSGAGKSTVARAAGRAFGWQVLPEAFALLEPSVPLTYRDAAELLATETRLLAEERRRSRLARSALRQGRPVLADTGFLGPVTYTAGLVALGLAPRDVLRRLVARAAVRSGPGALGPPEGTAYRAGPGRVLRRRGARDPVGHPPALAGRHRAVARFERDLLLRRFASWLPDRYVVVSGVGPPMTVARRLEEAVGSFPRRSPPAGTLARLLAEVEAAVRSSADGSHGRSAATVKKPARSAPAPSR